MTEQDPLPGMSRREIIEQMSPHDMVDHILLMSEKVESIKEDMDLAAEVLHDVYGLTVDQVLNCQETVLVAVRRKEMQDGR